MKALVGEFTQNEKWSVKGKLMGECWYKDCCVSEHPNNLRCGKPETVGGNEKMKDADTVQESTRGNGYSVKLSTENKVHYS